MITLWKVHYEIHDEVSKNDKCKNSFINWQSLRSWNFLLQSVLDGRMIPKMFQPGEIQYLYCFSYIVQSLTVDLDIQCEYF